MNYFKQFLVGMTGSIVGFILFLFIFNFAIHPMNFIYNSEGNLYELASKWEMEESDLVSDTVNFCKLFEGKDLIKCVVNNVGLAFNYTSRDGYTIKKSDDFNSGYICRDIAIVYSAIFRNLGFENQFLFRPNHVYNRIYNNDLDCEINMDRYWCW